MKITYSLSADGWGDGKSVCLWRKVGGKIEKVARFQSDYAAKLFASDFGFPLDDALEKRLGM